MMIGVAERWGLWLGGASDIVLIGFLLLLLLHVQGLHSQFLSTLVTWRWAGGPEPPLYLLYIWIHAFNTEIFRWSHFGRPNVGNCSGLWFIVFFSSFCPFLIPIYLHLQRPFVFGGLILIFSLSSFSSLSQNLPWVWPCVPMSRLWCKHMLYSLPFRQMC